MEKNRVQNEQILERVSGGSVFPSPTADGGYCIRCPFCDAPVTGTTRDECMRNYETHSKTCYSRAI